MATTTATFLQETGMPREEIDNIVNAIQRAFRKSIDSEQENEDEPEDKIEADIVSDILAEIDVSPEQAEIAATVIQQAYRRFKERKEREKQLLSGMVDWRVAARSAIHLYRKTGVSNEDANRAATLIKAAYKGYYTRQLLKRLTALEQDNFMLDIPDYLEEGEEGEFTDEHEESDERIKSVKIDYNTVIPHVDFNTSTSKMEVSQTEFSPRMSTASSIARHSLKYMFDAALERIGRQSTIAEETVEERAEGSAAIIDYSAEQDTHMSEIAVNQENLDTSRDDVPKLVSSVTVIGDSGSSSIKKDLSASADPLEAKPDTVVQEE